MNKAILVILSSLLLSSCVSSNIKISVDSSTYWTISFNSNGGSEIDPIKVKDGEKASKPTSIPQKEGYSFLAWYSDSFLTMEFDWSMPITADWTLFASYEKEETSSSIDSEEETSEGTSEEKDSKGHGPEGSSPVGWYLCGSGSLWGSDGWTISGGVQLFSNPNSDSDKGCILDISFFVGDTFKVTDGTTWYGYEKVDQSTSSSVLNKGKTNFAGESDGFGGNNIKCTVEGTYDIYINNVGSFWIQDAA